MIANRNYQGSIETPPQTPASASRFFNRKSGRGRSPPLVSGYFTPPDSRENSPSLRETSPNPQTRNSSFNPLITLENPPSPTGEDPATALESWKRVSASRFPRASPPLVQRQTSFSRIRSPPAKKVEHTIPPVPLLSGLQPSHGTFGRAENRRYQIHVGAGLSAEPSPAKSIFFPSHRLQKSDASSVVALPSTVYLPDEGGGYNNYSHKIGRSVSNPRYSPIDSSPPSSARSPSMSSPFLPLKPDTPVMATHPISQHRASLASSQAELIGLWKSAQRSRKVDESPYGSPRNIGKTYVLNMYRQAPLQTLMTSENPLAFPEHYTFGPNSHTPFYTIHAMRESPGDEVFNELGLLRRDPISGLDKSVITLGLEPPSRRILPAGDGLITLIYPKEAVLSAMSPATPVFKNSTGRCISPRRIRDNEERAGEAIQKAYSTECCRLTWDAERCRYYLYHPGVGNGGDAYLVEIRGEVGFDILGAKGSIKLINVETAETLTELDFGRSVLFINTRATSRIPSDHMVDVAVATILTVATVEGRRMKMVRMGQSQYAMSNASRPSTKQKRRGCLSRIFSF